jgi:thiamine-phosphate pyrophosphorylase
MPAKGAQLFGRLHVITDTRQGRDPRPVVAAALDAGATVIQVRAKGWPDRDLYDLAAHIVEQCRRYAATCVINDRVDVALATGADGVHLGADDLPVAVARRVLGGDAIVGGTARDPDGARAAVAAGASYLGVGPCYVTATKAGLPQPIGPDGVAAVADAIDVPVIAIGGIRAEQVSALRSAGAHGVAVIDAVSGARDARLAVTQLLAALAEAP